MCHFKEHKGHDCILLEESTTGIREEVVIEAKELESRAKILEESYKKIDKEIINITSVLLVTLFIL